VEQPLKTLYDRISASFCSKQKYSYTPKELLSPFLRSLQALFWSLFTGSLSMHVKLYGILENSQKSRDGFYHTNDGVKAEIVNAKYDRSYTFLNPNWEEIRKCYIGQRQFTTNAEFADYVIKNVSLFLRTATEKRCSTNIIHIALTPINRYFPPQDSTLEHKQSFIGKLPDANDSFSCTELQARAYLFAGVDLFPDKSPKGIYPKDFYETQIFTLLEPPDQPENTK